MKPAVKTALTAVVAVALTFGAMAFYYRGAVVLMPEDQKAPMGYVQGLQMENYILGEMLKKNQI